MPSPKTESHKSKKIVININSFNRKVHFYNDIFLFSEEEQEKISNNIEQARKELREHIELFVNKNNLIDVELEMKIGWTGVQWEDVFRFTIWQKPAIEKASFQESGQIGEMIIYPYSTGYPSLSDIETDYHILIHFINSKGTTIFPPEGGYKDVGGFANFPEDQIRIVDFAEETVENLIKHIADIFGLKKLKSDDKQVLDLLREIKVAEEEYEANRNPYDD